MRIGTFAKKNDLSVETIRYYMELGLLVPVKKGGHYDFSGNCQRSLDKVLTFKSMGFTLQEIRRVFHFSALTRLHSAEEKNFYKGYFDSNLKRIQDELQRLKEAEKLVLDTLQAMDDRDADSLSVIGVPLHVLEMLCCPKCKNSLMLKSGQVEENKIISGELACSCGMVYEISNGILRIDPIYIDMQFPDDRDMRVEYFETTSADYIEKVYISARWMENVMEDFEEKAVILEPGIGSGYALGQSLDAIPEGSVYFAVDHNMNRLEEIKSYFSRSELKFDLVLIGCDFLSIPLKDKTVDVLMDMSGSSNRAFESDVFLLDDIVHLMKEKASMYGLFIIAEGIDGKEIPPENHKLFEVDPIRKGIESHAFKILSEYQTGKVTEGGPHESYIDFVKSTRTYCCYACRE